MSDNQSENSDAWGTAPQPPTDAEWLREFAETYRNGTLKSVEVEYYRLRTIADKLEKQD